MKQTRELIIAITALSIFLLSSCKSEAKKQSHDSGEAVEITSEVSADILTLNTDESYIEWLGSKPGKDHSGKLYFESGEIRGDKAQGTIQGGTFIIDMNSLSNDDLTGEMKTNLEDHLKGEDFFHVDKYPTGCFEIASAVANKEENSYKITGNLSIKDVTLSISFNALITEAGGIYQAESETIILDRTKWGINYGSKNIFKDLKDSFIEDQIEIKLHLKTK